MKSADIKVGQDLFYSKASGWAQGHGWSTAHVRVVDTGIWTEGHRSGWSDPKYVTRKLEDGNLYQLGDWIYPVEKRGSYGTYGPLVVTVDRNGAPDTSPWVTAPQHLRGDYAECKAKVDKFEADRREGWKRAREAADRKKATGDQIRHDLARHGVLAGGFGDVSIDQHELLYLVRLLDAYDDVIGELSNLFEDCQRVIVGKDLVTRQRLEQLIEGLDGEKEKTKVKVSAVFALKSGHRERTNR